MTTFVTSHKRTPPLNGHFFWPQGCPLTGFSTVQRLYELEFTRSFVKAAVSRAVRLRECSLREPRLYCIWKLYLTERLTKGKQDQEASLWNGIFIGGNWAVSLNPFCSTEIPGDDVVSRLHGRISRLFYSPEHVIPSPSNPALHIQLRVPVKFLHSALSSHLGSQTNGGSITRRDK